MKIKGKRVQVSKRMKWEKNRMCHWIYLCAIQSGLFGPICICLWCSLNFTLFLFLFFFSILIIFLCGVHFSTLLLAAAATTATAAIIFFYDWTRFCCCFSFLLFFTPLMWCWGTKKQSWKKKNLFIYNEDLKETQKKKQRKNDVDDKLFKQSAKPIY